MKSAVIQDFFPYRCAPSLYRSCANSEYSAKSCQRPSLPQKRSRSIPSLFMPSFCIALGGGVFGAALGFDAVKTHFADQILDGGAGGLRGVSFALKGRADLPVHFTPAAARLNSGRFLRPTPSCADSFLRPAARRGAASGARWKTVLFLCVSFEKSLLDAQPQQGGKRQRLACGHNCAAQLRRALQKNAVQLAGRQIQPGKLRVQQFCARVRSQLLSVRFLISARLCRPASVS